jgi:fatty acid desaturase
VNSWNGALALAGDWLLIGAAIAASALGPGIPLYLAACLLIGSRMRALGNLLHEAAHQKLVASRRLNDLLGRYLCGWPLLVDYRAYCRDHRRHHQNLWRGEADPDRHFYLVVGAQRGTRGSVSYRGFLIRHVLLVVLLVMPLRRAWAARRLTWAGVRRWIPVAIAAVAAALLDRDLARLAVFYWAVPWLTTYQIFRYWAELGEHGGLEAFGHSWGSRNWRGSPLTNWFIAPHRDDNFHLLHHLFPAVPYPRLARLHGVCRRDWPAYAERGGCAGFFVGSRGAPSVLRDVWSGGPFVPNAGGDRPGTVDAPAG